MKYYQLIVPPKHPWVFNIINNSSIEILSNYDKNTLYQYAFENLGNEQIKAPTIASKWFFRSPVLINNTKEDLINYIKCQIKRSSFIDINSFCIIHSRYDNNSRLVGYSLNMKTNSPIHCLECYHLDVDK